MRKLACTDPIFNIVDHLMNIHSLQTKGPALYDHSLPVASNRQVEGQLQKLLILLDLIRSIGKIETFQDIADGGI